MQEDISFLCPTFKVVNVRREVSHHCLEGEHLFLRVLAFSDRAGRLTIEIQFLRAECHAPDVLGKEESPVVILMDYPLLKPQRIVGYELAADKAVLRHHRIPVIIKECTFDVFPVVCESWMFYGHGILKVLRDGDVCCLYNICIVRYGNGV